MADQTSLADQADTGARLDHVGLAVADLEAAVSWFCGVFGLLGQDVARPLPGRQQ